MCKQIENYIEENLTDEARQTALDFVTFLRINKIEFIKDNGYWKDKIYYMLKYKDAYVCFIAIKDPDEPENLWTIWSDDSNAYEDSDVDDCIKSTAWNYVDHCGNCGSCSGGNRKTIFGKSFERVCGCTFRIDNAKLSDLPFLEKMIDLRIKEIEKNI